MIPGVDVCANMRGLDCATCTNNCLFTSSVLPAMNTAIGSSVCLCVFVNWVVPDCMLAVCGVFGLSAGELGPGMPVDRQMPPSCAPERPEPALSGFGSLLISSHRQSHVPLLPVPALLQSSELQLGTRCLARLV